MADLVSQIFQQVPRPTNSGLGQFFAQGVAAGQRNRQLQLQEESLRLDDIAAGLKQQQFALEKGAAVAQQQAETDIATVLAAIYDNDLGFQNEDLVQQGMGIISKLPSNSRLGQQFLEGVKAADTIEAANRERARVKEEMGITPSSETFQLPGGDSITFRPRVTQEEQDRMVQDALRVGATDLSVDERGNVTGKTPDGKVTTTTVDSKGKITTTVEEGSGAMDIVAKRQINKQLRDLGIAQQQVESMVEALKSPAAINAFGLRGKVTSGRNTILAQIPGGEIFYDAKAGGIKMQLRVLREQVRSAFTDETGNISNADNTRIEKLFPNPDTVFTSVQDARRLANTLLETLNQRIDIVSRQAARIGLAAPSSEGQTVAPTGQEAPKTRAEFREKWKRDREAGTPQFKTFEELQAAYNKLPE